MAMDFRSHLPRWRVSELKEASFLLCAQVAIAVHIRSWYRCPTEAASALSDLAVDHAMSHLLFGMVVSRLDRILGEHEPEVIESDMS